MESLLKFLVILVVVAGILWVVSPLVYGAISGSIQKAPDLKIGGYSSQITQIPDSDCSRGMCEIAVSGTVFNFGGPAKNILLTAFFFDNGKRNIGSVNLPLIDSLGEQQSKEFSFTANFSCATVNTSVSIIHSERD